MELAVTFSCTHHEATLWFTRYSLTVADRALERLLLQPSVYVHRVCRSIVTRTPAAVYGCRMPPRGYGVRSAATESVGENS